MAQELAASRYCHVLGFSTSSEKALVRSFFYEKPSKAVQAEDEAAETGD